MAHLVSLGGCGLRGCGLKGCGVLMYMYENEVCVTYMYM